MKGKWTANKKRIKRKENKQLTKKDLSKKKWTADEKGLKRKENEKVTKKD